MSDSSFMLSDCWQGSRQQVQLNAQLLDRHRMMQAMALLVIVCVVLCVCGVCECVAWTPCGAEKLG